MMMLKRYIIDLGLASKTPQAYVSVDVLTFDLNLCACPKLKFKVYGEYLSKRKGMVSQCVFLASLVV